LLSIQIRPEEMQAVTRRLKKRFDLVCRRPYYMERSQYDQIRSESLNRSADSPFWLNLANESLEWFIKPTVAINDKNQWFPDGKINLTTNALDRHVRNGHGNRVAIHYYSSMGGASRDVTYQELLHDVSSMAKSLVDQGVKIGDRVLIYMPMIPETMVAMLACNRYDFICQHLFFLN